MSSAAAPIQAETDFRQFRFHQALLRGLAAAGFQTPRPIQSETIPAALRGRDVLGLAQTGTGKTAAFGLPILQRLMKPTGPRPAVLVLAPTRELAQQIDAELRLLAKFTRIQTATVFGGVSQRSQVQRLQRMPQIVVGCPGRVLDLMQQGHLDLCGIETLVLDEADHMFDMGFLPDIRRILGELPAQRQNLLFSATMPKAIRGLADDVLNRPHVVELAHSAPAERIEHALYPVTERRKREALDLVLAEEGCESAIVFTRTKHRARKLARELSGRGHRAVALQGNMSQSQRDRAMRGFRSGRFDILVATDIAARGIDVAGIDCVINYDPPNTPEGYTHRIGRTGRSEASGRAVTFITRDDRAWVHATERVLGATIARGSLPGFEAETRTERQQGHRTAAEPRRPRARRASRSREHTTRSASRRHGPSRRRGAHPRPS